MTHRLGYISALFVIYLFFSSLPASGQRWSGALKVGGAYTTFNGELASGSTDWEYLAGLAGGGTLGYYLNNNFVVQLDIMYTRMGASTNTMDMGIPVRLTSELTYLSFPFLLHYRIDTGRYVHPRLFAGPSIAFQLNAYLTIEPLNNGMTLTEQDASIENIDIGTIAGAGLEYQIGSQHLLLEARYYLGSSDITKPDEFVRDTRLRNQGIIILIGILF